MFHILVVDDDKNARFVMTEILESDGYTVFAAKDADEAFALIEKEHIDIAVIDIMMPRVDGYELTKALRDFNQDLPILMVSAVASLLPLMADHVFSESTVQDFLIVAGISAVSVAVTVYLLGLHPNERQLINSKIRTLLKSTH